MRSAAGSAARAGMAARSANATANANVFRNAMWISLPVFRATARPAPGGKTFETRFGPEGAALERVFLAAPVGGVPDGAAPDRPQLRPGRNVAERQRSVGGPVAQRRAIRQLRQVGRDQPGEV